MSKWRWVWCDAEKNGRLFQVGILADGSLYNPNNYPVDIVRPAVLAAETRRHERRSKAAKKAAGTRTRRQQARVLDTAKRVAAAQKTGPRSHCFVCGKHLSDEASIARGIGSECWQGVLGEIERERKLLASLMRSATKRVGGAS